MKIGHEELTGYLEKLLKQRPAEIMKLEAYAEKHGVPIMEPTGIEVLLQLLSLKNPKKFLKSVPPSVIRRFGWHLPFPKLKSLRSSAMKTGIGKR